MVHGTQAMICRRTGIGAPALSRIVHGNEPAYPKRGMAIAEAIGCPGKWEELFEEEPGDVVDDAPRGANGQVDLRRVPRGVGADTG